MSSSQKMSTADPKELETFKNISSMWWDRKGPLKGLHSMNQVRVPLILDGLAKAGMIQKELIDTSEPLKDLLVLEAGCGGGILSEALAKLGGTVVGVDPSPELIQQAKEHAALDSSLSKLKYFCEAVEEHAVNNHEKYDVIVASEVLEHVLNHEVFLEACAKCLKPGGSIFLTTQSRNWISWFGAIILPEYIIGYIPRGAHEYNKFISPSETQKILEGYNCRTRGAQGYFYNFFNDSWHWSWTTLVSYGLHAEKILK